VAVEPIRLDRPPEVLISRRVSRGEVPPHDHTAGARGFPPRFPRWMMEGRLVKTGGLIVRSMPWG
jgi:hypothetical protein